MNICWMYEWIRRDSWPQEAYTLVNKKQKRYDNKCSYRDEHSGNKGTKPRLEVI